MNVRYITNEEGDGISLVVMSAEDFIRLGLQNRLPEDTGTKTDTHPLQNAAGRDDFHFEEEVFRTKTVPAAVLHLMLLHNSSLIAAWRMYRGLSRKEVAKIFNKSVTNIAQMEKQGVRPQKKNLQMLAKLYDCHIDQLIIG